MDRLWRSNLRNEYPNLGKCIGYSSLGGCALLQKNYGLKNDCTLTSLAFLYGANRYPQIEQIALRYGYNGDTCGTNPLMIKAIMRSCNKQFGVSGICYVKYGKGIGYSYETVKALISCGTRFLLNLLDDGRKYYHNHTVTVIGYEEYERGRFLLVYDNWNSSVSHIDYDKLSFISSVNWSQ